MGHKEQLMALELPAGPADEALDNDGLALMRAIVAEKNFDPNADEEMTERMLLVNDELTNRMICSRSAVGRAAKLTVLRQKLHGQEEAALSLADGDREMQLEAIEAGAAAVLNILAEHPHLSRELQGPLLKKCFILRKEKYRPDYQASVVYFQAVEKLAARPDYDERLDETAVGLLLKTQYQSPNYGLLYDDYGGQLSGLKMLRRIAANSCLTADAWEKIASLTMARIVRLGGDAYASSHENVNWAVRKMVKVLADTFVELLANPRLAEIVEKRPAYKLQEVIRSSSVCDVAEFDVASLSNTIRNLSPEQRQSLERLDQAARGVLPPVWSKLIFERQPA